MKLSDAVRPPILSFFFTLDLFLSPIQYLYIPFTSAGLDPQRLVSWFETAS